MPLTVLLTLGRLPVALELARAFTAAGHRVIMADPFAMHLGRFSRAVARHARPTAPAVDVERYVDDLLTIVRTENVDLVVPVSEEIVAAAALIERLSPGVTFYGADRARLSSLHDKLAFACRARAIGLDVPDTFRAEDPAARALAVTCPIVSKPRFGCAGGGLRLHARGSDLAGVPSDHLVQRRLEGRHLSSFAIADQGRVVLSVVYEGKVFSGTSAVAFARVDHASSERWIERFVAAERWTGFIAFDFIADEGDRVVAIECNPRTTSGIHFVEPRALVDAILCPQEAAPVFKRAMLMQEFWSALSATYGQVLTPRRLLAALGTVVRARDVTWSRSDPFVFPLMTFSTWRVIWGAIRSREPFAVVATRDITWQPSAIRCALDVEARR